MADDGIRTCRTAFGPCPVIVAGPPEGPPVVLLHGYAAWARQWQRLIPLLAQRYRVYAPDLLGFGDAPKPRGIYTPERWAAQVRDLLDAFAVPRAVIVGHSLGGLVALTVARLYPERVAGFALIDALGLPTPDMQRLLQGGVGLLARVLRAPGLGELIFWAIRGERRLARSLALGAYHDPARAPDDAVATWLALIHRPRAHRAYLGVVRQLERYRADVAPGELATPCLIIWGSEDRGMPRLLAEGFQRLLPQAEVVIIPESGHVPHSEHPAEVAAALAPFLKQMEAAMLAPAIE